MSSTISSSTFIRPRRRAGPGVPPATEALELEKSGLSYQRVPPGYRIPYGHTHKKQSEVYVVLRGSKPGEGAVLGGLNRRSQ